MCRENADGRCEECSIAEGAWRMGEQRLYQVKLQAAHLDHDPWNLYPRLKALCQDCHLKHDASENGKKAHKARRQNIRQAMLAAGQLEMFSIEIQR